MERESLNVTAEDAFALFDMWSAATLFPHPHTMGTLAVAAADISDKWRFVWDFRRARESVYSDIVDAFDEAGSYLDQAIILASPENRDMVASAVGRGDPGRRLTTVRSKPITGTKLDLASFSEDIDGGDDDLLADVLGELGELEDAETTADFWKEHNLELGLWGSAEAELDDYHDLVDSWEFEHQSAKDDESFEALHLSMTGQRSQLLNNLLDSISHQSLMSELAMFVDGDRITVAPYHAHSVHFVDSSGRETLVRPGRLSNRYWRTFRDEIVQLERLVNEPDTSERDIETLLMSNPLFLRGLNYSSAYGQVVLPRPGDKSLRPDIIVEPFEEEWAHIIELKLPSERILVGRPNRARLAATLHSVVAQLREYSAYFDDRRLAQITEARYGFKCYRPRLVAIVGRDPKAYSPDEMRRALTAYPDLELVTYDRLLRAARSLLLL
jgi:hypothetical protein